MKNIHLLLAGESYVSLNCSYRDSAIGTEVGKPYWTYTKDWKHYMSITDASVRPHNIYITNEEEIKEGDWFIHFSHGTTTLLKCKSVNLKEIIDNEGKNCWLEYSHKIILTTDQELIKDGVQAIDDEFLEWFVKNPSCEEVVFSTYHVKGDISGKLHYKVIIPKEEAFKHKVEVLSKEEILANRSNAYDFIDFDKQETLEEGAENYSAIHGERYEVKGQLHFVNTFMDVENAFVAGAKWQKEQDKNKFSEEEIRNIAEASFSFYRTNEFSDDELEVEWRNWLEKRIELLKKK